MLEGHWTDSSYLFSECCLRDDLCLCGTPLLAGALLLSGALLALNTLLLRLTLLLSHHSLREDSQSTTDNPPSLLTVMSWHCSSVVHSASS